jgi:hypothetical protein
MIRHVVPMSYISPFHHVLIYNFTNLKYVTFTAYILVEKSGNKYGRHFLLKRRYPLTRPDGDPSQKTTQLAYCGLQNNFKNTSSKAAARFEVLTAVVLDIKVFCDVMPCRLVRSNQPTGRNILQDINLQRNCFTWNMYRWFFSLW